MNSPDELAKALAQNGTFDPEKAATLKQKALGIFETRMRKVERILFVYLCLCCWLLVFTLFHFLASSSTKALLFYGLLMLIFFETTILMKLWYWIMNNKISVLKAVKQVELGGTAGDDAEAKGKADGLGGPLVGLPRWERKIWWIVLLAGGALIGAVKQADLGGALDRSILTGAGSLTSRACITLAADGSGSEVTEMSTVHRGTLAQRGFSYHAPKGADVRFADGRGRKIDVTASSGGEQVHYIVRLARPVMPGSRFSYTRTTQWPVAAGEKDGLWTYTTDYAYGLDTNEFSQTVVLPPGAEIVSADPWPAASFTLHDRPTLRFEGVRSSNEPFKYTVRYRLPEEPIEAKSPTP